MDIGVGFAEDHRQMLIELIDGYSGAFSKLEGYMGCYTEVTHQIRTEDYIPGRVPCKKVDRKGCSERVYQCICWANSDYT